MQIAPGHTPLSLAILKTLGSQPAAAAKAAAAPAPAAPAAPVAKAKVAAPAAEFPGGRTPPRGSFVDLRA